MSKKPAGVPAQLLDDLKKLRGLPPYDTWSNHCCGDGYFAGSIRAKWSAAQIDQANKYLDSLESRLNQCKDALFKG